MYAIISDGSHQYRVQEGQRIEIQLKELAEGEKAITFDRVLLIGDVEGGPKVGAPTVPGAKVSATLVRELKDDKIHIQKFRKRKGYSLKKGHRQKLLEVQIDKIHA